MNPGKSIITLYKILEKEFGPAEARMSVSAILSNVIGELQDEGIPVTEERINEGLAKSVDDYGQASKADVA